MKSDDVVAEFLKSIDAENPQFARAWAKEYLRLINRDNAIFSEKDFKDIIFDLLAAWEK